MIVGLPGLLEDTQRASIRQIVFSAGENRNHRRCGLRCRAEGRANDALSERLKAAESEANELRKQLEAARAAKAKNSNVSNSCLESPTSCSPHKKA